MRPGDILVLYSDGMTEAENPAGQPFEESGLDRVVAAHGLETPAELAPTILRAVEAHARDSRFTDDLTVLILNEILTRNRNLGCLILVSRCAPWSCSLCSGSRPLLQRQRSSLRLRRPTASTCSSRRSNRRSGGRPAGASGARATRHRCGSAPRLRQRHDVAGAVRGNDQRTRSRAAHVRPPAVDAGNPHRACT